MQFRALLATATLTISLAANADPISIGSLTYDEDVSATTVTDSLNNREYLRQDLLVGKSASEIATLIASGGVYAGFQIASNADALLALDALYGTQSYACASGGRNTLLSSSGEIRCDRYLGAGSPLAEAVMGGSYSSSGPLMIFPSGGSVGYFWFNTNGYSYWNSSTDVSTLLNRGGTYLLWRTPGSGGGGSHSVPEPSTLGLLCLGVAGSMAARRRKVQPAS